jgi:magnesium transporter
MDIFWYKKGTVQQVHHGHLKNNLHKIFREHDKVWVDMPSFGADEEELLKTFFGIHPLTIEDCAKSISRPKIEEFDTYLYVALYGINEQGHFTTLNFLVGEDYLITIQRHHIAGYEALKRDSHRLTELLARDTEFVMHHLVDVEVDKYYPILDKMDEAISGLESRVMKDTTPALVREIFNLKHQLISLKHHIGPQKDILFTLTRKGNKFMMPSSTDYFRDVYDHIVHAIDSIDNYREILNGTLDVHLSVMSNHMNDIIKVLTVVSTIFMPLTLIASIYGMNFRYLPELEWHYGYFVTIAFMGLIAAMMWAYFRRKDWV